MHVSEVQANQNPFLSQTHQYQQRILSHNVQLIFTNGNLTMSLPLWTSETVFSRDVLTKAMRNEQTDEYEKKMHISRNEPSLCERWLRVENLCKKMIGIQWSRQIIASRGQVVHFLVSRTSRLFSDFYHACCAAQRAVPNYIGMMGGRQSLALGLEAVAAEYGEMEIKSSEGSPSSRMVERPRAW